MSTYRVCAQFENDARRWPLLTTRRRWTAVLLARLGQWIADRRGYRRQYWVEWGQQ